jgi:type IV pilus assembly protein PilY1
MSKAHTSASNITASAPAHRANTTPAERLRGLWRASARRLVALVAALPLMVPTVNYASPPASTLTLADAPLFLQNAVQPNIFYMLDDSGSMDWEFVYNDGTGLTNAWDPNGIYYFTSFGDGTLDPSSAAERLFLCRGYNTLAYDPTATYTPWQGTDNGGVAYTNAHLYNGGTDASPNYNVRRNPFNTSTATANRSNLAAAGVMAYWNWTDSDTRYDAGECGTTTNDSFGVTFASLTDAQKKNFANWYVYYRKRVYVLKRAVSELIRNSQARVGLSTLWRNADFAGNSPGRQIEDIDDISIPVDTTAQTNKNTLLTHVGRITATNGTPLRRALDNVGRYYEGITQTALFGAAAGHTGTIDPDSPILNSANGGACQQNFTILMTDGYYNSGYGGTNVGNADGDSSSAFDSATSGGPYGDGQSNTLGDIAMHYYERDLWAGLTNNVPTQTGVDENSAQHMVTYTVAFGLSGNLDPFGTKNASACDTDPANACWGSSPNPYGGWPNVSPAIMEDDPEAVDDLWHAAYNGRGRFLGAQNPAQLISALDDAISDITGRTGTASSVTADGATLYTGSRVYIPRFTSGEWSGTLLAKRVEDGDEDGDTTYYELLDVTDWGSPTSDAGEVLKGQNWSTGRAILTWNGTQGRPFQWTNLNATQQNALHVNPSTLVSDGNGQERLEWLRGDHSKESPAGSYRQRTGGFVLGDIGNSSPVYVGAPSFFYPNTMESVTYSSFRGTYYNRTPIIYVGANDGMLHGFDANTGEEKIAYVPNAVFSRLNRLTGTTYSHNAYVDGTPTVNDVFYAGAWHTVLVGSLRAGGQGIFALDITDPSNFSEGNASSLVRWEFTDANDADLGFTFSKPAIAKMQNGKWAAIFGNGYNNSANDGNQSSSGDAVLFIVDIETGSLIRKIVTKTCVSTGGSNNCATPNGLATPAVIDYDGDSIADFAFAGDLQGNMWKFDLRGNVPAQWDVAKSGGSSPTPLFTASDGSNPQPITSRPEVTEHPTGQGGFMVFFGTGKYFEGGGVDTSNTQQQTFYAVWDEEGWGNGNHTTVANNKILAQTVTTDSTTFSTPVRTISNNTIATWGSGGGQYMGWKVNMPATRERVVSNPFFMNDGRIVFTSIVPDSDPCAIGGTSWIWQLNYVNGGPPPNTVFDTNGDGVFDSADNSGGQVVVGVQNTGILGDPVVLDSGSTGKGVLIKPEDTDTILGDSLAGRQTWRQLQ